VPKNREKLFDANWLARQTSDMKPQLENYARRTERYDNIDGTGEIRMGLMITGFAFMDYVLTVLPKDSMWNTHGAAGFLFFYMLLGPVLAVGYFSRKIIKQYLTWPRTGYVAYHDADSIAKAKGGLTIRLIVIIAVVAIVVIGLNWVATSKERPETSFRELTAYGSYAALFVLPYAFWVKRVGGGHPWKWLVFLCMALGIFMIGPGATDNFAGAIRLALWVVGLLWFISGMATLVWYIRHFQTPASPAQ
jgi:hypothetical protein